MEYVSPGTLRALVKSDTGTYIEDVISFSEWWQRLEERVEAWLYANDVYTQADNVHRDLVNTVPPLPPVIDEGADLANYMRAYEDILAQRAAALSTKTNEQSNVNAIATEIVNLANLRNYRSSAQPPIIVNANNQRYVLLINSDNTITVSVYNTGDPIPQPS